ncbi:MAG: LysR family transcriptional regulator [Sutterellaceae bacterium]|nr:LysR family transcriptional regulator [Sutterellaceae bacterium]
MTEPIDAATENHVADPIALTRQLEQMVDKRINILRRIHETGSISEAARLANVSYKAAWQAIETLGNLTGAPLLEKAVGGTKGGGTVLTPTGLTVLELSERLMQAREKVLAEFASRDMPELMPVSTSMLRTSMRNQFPVTLSHIARGPAMVRLQLKIDEENTLKASLTQESAQLLGLTQQTRLLALCKATAVEIAREIEPQKGASILKGTVIRTARNDKGGEVTIRLAGGTSLVGFGRAGHGLKLGDTAQALVSAQAVVVALFN